MTDPKTKFEQDCDALELACMKIGYGYAVTDLETILREALRDATTPEEASLILRIQTAIFAMESVRFPSVNTQN